MQTKLLEDILNSQASLNHDQSLLMFGQMLASVEEYVVYYSHAQEDTPALAERYINNDAWVIYDDMKYRTVDPANVAIYDSGTNTLHGIVYDNGGVWIINKDAVMLFVLKETATQEDYPQPS